MKQTNMQKTKPYALVVDEGVSEDTCRQFRVFLQKQGYVHDTTCMIARAHSGMPDGQIIRHLLNQETIFLTSDRPLHNTVLSHSLVSFYVSHDGDFISRPLKGIRTKVLQEMPAKDRCIKESYQLPQPAIREYLLPSSEKQLKKLRTKRRRIRNHFDGYDHMGSLSVSVSWNTCGSATHIGIRLRISSNTGVPALDASESYICENIPPEYRNQVALNYALIVPIQLLLHGIPTQIYYDAPTIVSPAEVFSSDDNTVYSSLFTELSKTFPQLEFVASTKGRFIEQLRKKLHQLATKDSNELIAGRIADIGQKIATEYMESPKDSSVEG